MRTELVERITRTARRLPVESQRKALEYVRSLQQHDDSTVLRVDFGNEILSTLSKLKEHAGTSHAIPYASALLKSIRQMIDELEPSPFLQVFAALLDALAYDKDWVTEFTSDQFEGAYKVIESVVKTSNLTQEMALDAIMALQKLGFDPVPFEIDYDDEDENTLLEQSDQT